MTQTIAPAGHVPQNVRTAPRGTPRTRAVRGLLALLLAVAGVLFGGASPASAHAALTGSDPAQGAVVDKAPTEVSLTFSEQVALSDGSLQVLDPRAQRVDTGAVSHLNGTTYGVKVRAGLPDGTYTVTYQVVSADSHPVSGAFTFSIGAPSATTVSVSGRAAGGGVVGGLYGFARYVSYAGFIVLIGGAAFVLACWQRGAGVRAMQRLVVSGWIALTSATLALLLLRGSYTGSGKVADIVDLSLVGQVLQTKAGAALVSRLLLLAAAALFIAVLFGAYVKRDADGEEAAGGDGGRGAPGGDAPGVEEDDQRAAEKLDLTFGLGIGGTVVAAGLAATWAMAEHASTGLQPGLAMPVDVLHLLAVALWLGGVVALLVALYRAPSIGTAAVRRFSRLAFGSVVTLAATGIYQSWRQVGSWSALTGTTYGQLLLVKVGLVAVLVGIAWTSRRWTARLADAPTTAVATKGPAKKESSAGKKHPAAKKRAAVAAKASAKGGVSAKAGGSEKAAGTASGTGKGSGAPGKAEGPPSSRKGGGPGGRTPGGSGRSERAAQLARQQAAMAAARAKRVRDADPVRAGLRRSVLAEAAVAVVLLAVTTALTTTEPGRTEEAAQAATASASQRSGPLSLKIPFETGGQDGKGTVQITLDPARVGGNEMHVYVVRSNGQAFDVPEVKVAFTLAAKGIGPLPVVPDRIATGHWSAAGVQIPMAGDWQIAVTVRTSDIDQVTVNKNAKIG
ncbi:copper resistance CopC/CopD family protein [Streptomyces sp. TP-A0356]|uniref:copper resistance CopC/CopD family protein n=1 Tax=Streptomyces sp. TP-A0356 TaxID=1359208 RepID=UPI00099E523C|nr:copper resistance protein CopC [Streptomyces sp. TP-A0356]